MQKSTDQTWIDYRPQFVKAVENNLKIIFDREAIKDDKFHKLFEYSCQMAMRIPNEQKPPQAGIVVDLKTETAAKVVTKEMLDSVNISYKEVIV